MFNHDFYYLDLLDSTFVDLSASMLSPVEAFYIPYFSLPPVAIFSNLALLLDPTLTAALIEGSQLSVNYENPILVYHYSIPTSKLAYPEPFVASASLMHSDLWFVHILIYQY